jgi:hypothetical protein
MDMAVENDIAALMQAVLARFMDLALAPVDNVQMLWAAIPLAIATLFITLYFGRHRGEELGWNTAFGNSMVFLFTAIGLIKEMYARGGGWESVLSNEYYLLLTAGLSGASVLLMVVTYFHLMPRRAAFFLFSAPPINAAVYVFMAIVYAGVPPNAVTALAGALLMLAIAALAKIIQLALRLAGLSEAADRSEDDRVRRIAEKVEEELRRRDAGNRAAPRPSRAQAPPPSRKSAQGTAPR